MQLKIDLHVHTIYSYDSSITLKELVFYAKKKGLDGVAVTDHNRLDGALKIAKETNFLVIPGMEITSLKGHIIGLNVQEPVPLRLSVKETVDRIHDAGGIAVACHPGAPFKGSLRENVTSDFDAVEVINSSAIPFRYSVEYAEKIASRLGKARVAGSDAHYGPEIGYAYTLINSESNVDEVVKAVKNGRCSPLGEAIPLRIRLKRKILFFKRRFQ